MLNQKNILNKKVKSGRVKVYHVFYSIENDKLLSMSDMGNVLKDYKKHKKYINFDYRISRDNHDNNILMIEAIDNKSKYKTKFLDEYILLWNGINNLGGWQVFTKKIKDLCNL